MQREGPAPGPESFTVELDGGEVVLASTPENATPDAVLAALRGAGAFAVCATGS